MMSGAITRSRAVLVSLIRLSLAYYAAFFALVLLEFLPPQANPEA